MLSLVEIPAIRLESNFPPMTALEFIRDHVTFKLPFDFSYHMKTPIVFLFTLVKRLFIKKVGQLWTAKVSCT